MQTYCLSCKKHTDNACPKKAITTNKVIRQKSRCANCMANKLLFFKQQSKKDWNIIISKLFIY